MTEPTPVSEEVLLLATIVGAAMAGIATEIRLKSPIPNPEVQALFNKGVSRLNNSRALMDVEPAVRDALIAAFRKGAIV